MLKTHFTIGKKKLKAYEIFFNKYKIKKNNAYINFFSRLLIYEIKINYKSL